MTLQKETFFLREDICR